VAWLVDRQLAAVGKAQRGHEAESLVADLPGELNPLRLQLLDRAPDALQIMVTYAATSAVTRAIELL
jgi:hypothetical protein